MAEDKNANYWIKELGLMKHPEGGYFKETFRADEQIEADYLPERYSGTRSFGTSIYFLLTTESVSNFHRLSSDEIWHFHTGGATRVHFISPQGVHSYNDIGPSLESGQQFQVVIPRGHWFAAEVIEGDYTLVGCTVAPGFEFEDFLLAERKALVSEFPDLEDLITRFSK